MKERRTFILSRPPSDIAVTRSAGVTHRGESGLHRWVAPRKVDRVPRRGGRACTADVAFDQSVAAVRETLGQLGDVGLQGSCSFTKSGAPMMSMPKMGVVRTIILNHSYHHRGQLSVFHRKSEGCEARWV